MFHSEPGWQYCRVHTCFVITHISLPTSNLWTTIRNHSWGNNMVILLFIYLANNNNYDNSWLWWYLCHDSIWSMCLRYCAKHPVIRMTVVLILCSCFCYIYICYYILLYVRLLFLYNNCFVFLFTLFQNLYI